MKTRKTGILGGTFNPIHMGHLIIAEQAIAEFGLDEVIVMPSGTSYLKKDIVMPDGEVRLQMARLAAEDNPRFTVSDMEIKRGGNTYTADTIEELKNEEPERELFFITGADCFHEIRRWISPDRIFAGCTVLVSVRNGDALTSLKEDTDFYTREYGAKIKMLHTPFIDISSSMLRGYVKEGKSIRYYVPDKVREYIIENGLYLDD